jgi:hypothetical protein
MRASLLLLGLAFAPVGETDEGPVAPEKWKSDHTEKAWGLKLKAVRYTTGITPAEVRVALEFTKDLTPEQGKALADSLTTKPTGLEFCFLDKEGACIYKVPGGRYRVEGDLAGKKGHVVRLRLVTEAGGPAAFLDAPGVGERIARVELRPGVAPRK